MCNNYILILNVTKVIAHLSIFWAVNDAHFLSVNISCVVDLLPVSLTCETKNNELMSKMNFLLPYQMNYLFVLQISSDKGSFLDRTNRWLWCPLRFVGSLINVSFVFCSFRKQMNSKVTSVYTRNKFVELHTKKNSWSLGSDGGEIPTQTGGPMLLTGSPKGDFMILAVCVQIHKKLIGQSTTVTDKKWRWTRRPR